MLWVAVESHSNSQHASEEVIYSGVARADIQAHCLVPRWPMNGLDLLHLLCCEAVSSGRSFSSFPPPLSLPNVTSRYQPSPRGPLKGTHTSPP